MMLRLTGQDVGVSVLWPVDGKVCGIMGKLQTNALQLLNTRQTLLMSIIVWKYGGILEVTMKNIYIWKLSNLF